MVYNLTWGGFLIRRSSAIRRFIAGFLKCDSRTIMKSFLKKIARELIGNLHKNPPKFPENSRALFLRNDFIIVRLSHVKNPAINQRIAERRLMRNPPLVTVDSGVVPQLRYSFRSILFLLHINDLHLPSVISSKVRLFADDCLVSREIKSRQDQNDLQKDLNLLESWGTTWGMRFNAAKCNIMRVSGKQTPIPYQYELSGQVLEEVKNANYLGVTVSDDLEWTKHILLCLLYTLIKERKTVVTHTHIHTHTHSR